MLHFLRTALLAVLFCLATSAFSQREAVIGISPDYSSYATLISQQDTSLVFVTDQRDTISLTILKKPWKMMSRIGTLRPGDRYALIVQADDLPGVVYSYVNLTQLQQRWISLTDGNTLVFSPGGGLCGSASVSLDNYRIDNFFGTIFVKFHYFYPTGRGTYGIEESETLLKVKELTDSTLDVVLKLSDLYKSKLDDWHMKYRCQTPEERQNELLKRYGVRKQ